MPRSGRPASQEARDLIAAQGLNFEDDFDDFAELYDGGRLVACGARAGYVLKMVTIEPAAQGSDALGRLMTELVGLAYQAGHETVFVFTRSWNVASFRALNFRLLVSDGPMTLLEHGPGLEDYFAEHTAILAPGNNGAVVVNGNPFTLGHLHLVEWAARHVDRLYLFVVSEERSTFPFATRFRLAQAATQHIPNVAVLETSRYSVSAGTFPSYFSRQLHDSTESQMRIDLLLFAERIAPHFGIRSRFAGQEPLCETTAAYNRMMADILEAHAIHWVEIPRLQIGGRTVSASLVRKAWAEGELDHLQQLVPPTTFSHLLASRRGTGGCPGEST